MLSRAGGSNRIARLTFVGNVLDIAIVCPEVRVDKVARVFVETSKIHGYVVWCLCARGGPLPL